MDQGCGSTEKAVRNLDRQILAVLFTMLGSAIVIITLQGTKDRLLDVIPGKDYSYLERLPRISGLMFLLTAVFYFCDSCDQCRKTPGQRNLNVLLAANFLAMVAAVVKLELIYTRPRGESARQQAAQSTELGDE